MRILVIGGTRFIGPPVVNRLYEAGHSLRLFHRQPADIEFPPEVEHIYGDRRADWDAIAPELVAFQPDVVLDMVPITEADATRVVETFRGVAQRLVSISSQDVYRAYGRINGTEPGDPDPVPLAEDAPLREQLYPYRGETPRPPDHANRILDDYDKILVERVVMNEPDLPATVLRLPMVYGPRDYQHRLYQYLKRMDDGRPAILLDTLTARWRWTRDFVDNTAAAIALSVTDKRAAGRVYNVGEEHPLTMVEWIDAIGQAAGWIGDIVTAADYQLPDHLRAQAGLEQHLVADTTRIRAELDFMPHITLDEALRRTVIWERAHPPEQVDPALFDYATEDYVLSTLGRG
ncbi:MAG: NAD-dependent epimerase/dehydratase family protein [Chloroflexi bacterium]|nr:NAD-dependent epimerase/dehydratase family protein [Chloroflexota bacterium]